jgi:Co/Zn/Cd efflux system component
VIIGLVAGRQLGWTFMDPVMGLVGAIVIMSWSWTLVRSAGAVLLDVLPDRNLPVKITERLETDGDRISDLHLWRVGPGHISGIVALVSSHPQSPSAYKARLADLAGLSHLTVEVEPCPDSH